ncbi:unnamed protein product, partial [Arabidopsis halleri]
RFLTLSVSLKLAHLPVNSSESKHAPSIFSFLITRHNAEKTSLQLELEFCINKLLLHAREDFQPVEKQPVVIHDLHTKSYDFVFRPTTFGFSIYYFQSLFSVLPI